MPQTKVDVGVLYADLNQKRRLEGLSWRDLASQLEISASTFTRMAQGARPDIDGFATLLRWLDRPASTYMKSDDFDAPPANSAHDDLQKIGSLLRASQNMSAEQAQQLEQLIEIAYKSIAAR